MTNGVSGRHEATRPRRLTRAISWILASPVHAGLAAALALVLSYAFTSLWLPFGWDHGMLASVGDVIAHGGMPFKDDWDLKGPLSYLPYGFFSYLFGNTMWGVRVFEIAIMVPTLLYFVRVIGGHTSVTVAAGAALGLYLWVAASGFGDSAQPEEWAMALVTVAMCLVLRPDAVQRASVARFVFCGFLIGAAGLIKPHFLAFGLGPLAFLAIAPGLALTRRAALASGLAIGPVLPFAAIAVWLAAGGALPALFEIVEFIAGPYAGGESGHSLPLSALVPRMLAYFSTGAMPCALLFAFVGLWARRRESVLIVPLLIWLAVALLAIAVQAKLYAYHWFLLYAPLMAGAALGVHALLESARGSSAVKALLATTILVFTAQVAASPARDVGRWARLMIDGDVDKYYAGYYSAAYYSNDIVNAAAYVREHTSPDERVFVWGNDATIRYLSQRGNPTRFDYVLPLTLNGPQRPAWRAEMMQNLEQKPPAYIAIGSPWGAAGPFGPKEDSWKDFPEFERLLVERYVLEATFGNVSLYQRADRTASEG